MTKSRKIAKRASTKPTTATSKISLKIEVADPLRNEIRGLEKTERREIGAGIDRALAAWGKPHLHAGAGIRKLQGDYFECRIGLHRRLLFKVLENEILHFKFMGNHDDVRRFIRAMR